MYSFEIYVYTCNYYAQNIHGIYNSMNIVCMVFYVELKTHIVEKRVFDT